MTKKLAVFDWNGTLFDDAPENLIAFNACMDFFGQPQISMERYHETMDFPLVHVYAKNGIPASTYLEKFREATDVYNNVYLPLAEHCQLRRGTIPLLDYLVDDGYDLMVLSNQRHDILRTQVYKLHIGQYFYEISGNEAYDVASFTRVTKRDRFQNFWDTHDYDPKESFIIGDSLEEPEVAKAFGLMSFSVSWGIFSRSRLLSANPCLVLDELDELRQYLENKKKEKAA